MNYKIKTTNILVIISLFLFSCGTDDGKLEELSENNPNEEFTIVDVPGTDVKIVEFLFDSDDNSRAMYYDGESVEAMTSSNRRFSTNALIRVRAVDNFTLEVANFLPVDMDNVDIYASIDKGAAILLFSIKKIRAFGIQEIQYPFMSRSDTRFLTVETNEIVDLQEYKDAGISPDQISFDFGGDTEMIKKLEILKDSKWAFKMHDFNSNNDPNSGWKLDPTAGDCRRMISIMINTVFAFHDPKFKKIFMRELFKKPNMPSVVTIPKEPIAPWIATTEEKEHYYSRLTEKTHLNLGVVVNRRRHVDNGNLGISENSIERNFLRNVEEPDHLGCGGIIVHELALSKGFSFHHSMTYPNSGRLYLDQKWRNGLRRTTGLAPVWMLYMSRKNKNLGSELKRYQELPVTCSNYAFFPDDNTRLSCRPF